MADSNYTQQFLDIVGQSDIGKQMLSYLTAAAAMPAVQQGVLPYDVYGEFDRNAGPAGTITVQKGLSPAQMKYTGTHETSHATDRAMKSQADSYKYTPGSSQFEDAYDKLARTGTRGMWPLQYSDPRYAMAFKLNPEWAKQNIDYRSSPAELASWAVDSLVRQPQFSDSYTPPAHLNATLAQEFSILLDLALRDLKRQKESKK